MARTAWRKSWGRDGVDAARIHGDRTQSQRNQALAGFKKGDYRVLVATDVAARGIHVDGIAHVVNYDLPQVPEDFIHRVGRTARAGARGTASTFSTRAERNDIRQIEKALGVRLTPREAGADLEREEKSPKTVVIPIQRHKHPGGSPLIFILPFMPGKWRTNKGLQGFCICAILSLAFETPVRRLNLNETTSLDRINRTRREFQR